MRVLIRTLAVRTDPCRSRGDADDDDDAGGCGSGGGGMLLVTMTMTISMTMTNENDDADDAHNGFPGFTNDFGTYMVLFWPVGLPCGW